MDDTSLCIHSLPHHQLFIDQPDCELGITIVVIFALVLGPPVHSHKEGKPQKRLKVPPISRQAASIDVDIIDIDIIDRQAWAVMSEDDLVELLVRLCLGESR